MSPRFIAFVLLVVFAMQSFQKNLIVLDYVANMASYIKTCINKDRPQLACKGKCQMMKKIKAEEEKGDQNPDRKGENKSQTLFPLFVATFNLPQPHEPVTVYPTFSVAPPVDRPYAIFHPPALI